MSDLENLKAALKAVEKEDERKDFEAAHSMEDAALWDFVACVRDAVSLDEVKALALALEKWDSKHSGRTRWCA